MSFVGHGWRDAIPTDPDPPNVGAPSTATVTGTQPTTVVHTAPYIMVIVDGTGFTTTTKICVNGQPIAQTIYIGPTQVQTNYVAVPVAGIYRVSVQKPGERRSNSVNFTVT